MGYAVTCVVWDCEDKISIENRWDLWENAQNNPKKKDRYSWYSINKNQFEDGILNIYDMKIRIFVNIVKKVYY